MSGGSGGVDDWGALLILYRDGGNERAFERFVLLATAELSGRARRLYREDPEDLVQETLAQVCARVDQLKAQESWVAKGWVRQILKNEVGKRIRRPGWRRLTQLSWMEDEVPERELASEDMVNAILEDRDERSATWERVLGVPLTPREREVLLLSLVHRNTNQEIAETLGLASGAVKRYMHDARKKIQVALGALLLLVHFVTWRGGA